MNKFVLAALLCPFVGMAAQTPDPAGAEDWMPGSYRPAPLDSPLVKEAKAFVQKHLAAMTLTEVTEAYTQVVAGMNVRLICSVTADDGPSTWQFIAYQTLDGRWHFWSAKRM